MTTQHTTKDRVALLLRDGRDLYHTQDLAVLWGIDNANTLYTTIRRYVARGILHRIYKGFYSSVPSEQLDPLYLGLVALHRYGYVSTESVLAKEGIIFQDISSITLVSSISKRMNIEGHAYTVRRMNPIYLHNDAGVIKRGIERRASVERAVADMLYFNPQYHFDGKDRIDWDRVRELQDEVGY